METGDFTEEPHSLPVTPGAHSVQFPGQGYGSRRPTEPGYFPSNANQAPPLYPPYNGASGDPRQQHHKCTSFVFYCIEGEARVAREALAGEGCAAVRREETSASAEEESHEMRTLEKRAQHRDSGIAHE